MSYLVGSATELPPDQAGPVLPAPTSAAPTAPADAKPAITPAKSSIGMYVMLGVAAYAVWYWYIKRR